jgi:hypothetical protein
VEAALAGRAGDVGGGAIGGDRDGGALHAGAEPDRRAWRAAGQGEWDDRAGLVRALDEDDVPRGTARAEREAVAGVAEDRLGAGADADRGAGPAGGQVDRRDGDGLPAACVHQAGEIAGAAATREGQAGLVHRAGGDPDGPAHGTGRQADRQHADRR